MKINVAFQFMLEHNSYTVERTGQLRKVIEMAKINRESRVQTEEFNALRVNSRAINEDNDCGVKAIALACAIDYNEAHALAASFGRRQRRGMSTANIIRAIETKGFYMLDKNIKEEFISKYPKSHQILKSATTHHPERFNSVWADGKTYVMFVSCHVLTIINGVNHDHTKGKAKRALSVYEVVKIDESNRESFNNLINDWTRKAAEAEEKAAKEEHEIRRKARLSYARHMNERAEAIRAHCEKFGLVL